MRYVLMMKVLTIYPSEDHTGFQKMMKVGCISKSQKYREKKQHLAVVQHYFKSPKLLNTKAIKYELKTIFPPLL